MELKENKESNKFALFKKIQEKKDILFGKFSESVTKQLKDDTWESILKELVAEGFTAFQEKTAKQLKDSMWSQSKTRTMEKLDKSKKTGMGGVKFSEVEKLLLAIVDTESPQVKGMNVLERGKMHHQL